MTITHPRTTTPVAFEAADLKAALLRLKPVITSGRGQLPVLTHVRIDFDGTTATLTATDLENTLETTLPAVALDAGSLLVPYARLAKALGVYKKGTITIERMDATTVSVRHGKSSVELHAVDVAEFPVLNDAPEDRRALLQFGIFAELFPAISTDVSRPILMAVLVENGTYVATDSYRMHIIETGDDTGNAFLVGRAAAAILAKYSGCGAATIGERDLRVRLDNHTTLTSRLVDGTFPLWRSLVPSESTVIARFDDSFLAEIKNLMALGITEPSTPLVIGEHADGIELSFTRQNVGVARTVVPGTYENTSAMAFNPHYLVEILKGVTSRELLGCGTTHPVLSVEDAPEFGVGASRKRLLMPVRLEA